MNYKRIITDNDFNLSYSIIKISCRFFKDDFVFYAKTIWVTETNKYYKTNTETIKKDSLLKPLNTLTNHTGCLGFYLYCLEEDIEKGLEIIKTKMYETIKQYECEIIKLKEKYEKVFCK